VREAELARALTAAGRVNRVQLAALAGSDAPGRTQVSRRHLAEVKSRLQQRL
jgi:uncharacterized protein with ACT and thioredoxin-like domain